MILTRYIRQPRYLYLAAIVAIAIIAGGAGSVARAETFASFLKGVEREALTRGITKATLNQAFRGLTPDPNMDRLTKRQPELVKPIGGYIERRANGGMLKTGRRKLKGVSRTMKAIERTYGVDPYVVVAIWGMETGYGGGIGTSDVFRSLATLGWKRYRGDFFIGELLDALTILQQEGITRKQMVGSWAGAMGQTQFIPSSFLKYAVDFDKDGKRNLWKSRADALASTANYLSQKGWQAGQPWGVPVTLPTGYKRNVETLGWKQWKVRGVKPADGSRFPTKGTATLFFPAGAEGPAFLITPNYEVIRDYNSSDAYSLSAGLLANRLRGRKRFVTKWPTDKTLNKAQRMKVQELLVRRGHSVPNRTGRILKGVRLAIRDFQHSKGLVADGYPDRELLRQLSR